VHRPWDVLHVDHDGAGRRLRHVQHHVAGHVPSGRRRQKPHHKRLHQTRHLDVNRLLKRYGVESQDLAVYHKLLKDLLSPAHLYASALAGPRQDPVHHNHLTRPRRDGRNGLSRQRPEALELRPVGVILYGRRISHLLPRKLRRQLGGAGLNSLEIHGGYPMRINKQLLRQNRL
jgi:hypothetical protein